MDARAYAVSALLGRTLSAELVVNKVPIDGAAGQRNPQRCRYIVDPINFQLVNWPGYWCAKHYT